MTNSMLRCDGQPRKVAPHSPICSSTPGCGACPQPSLSATFQQGMHLSTTQVAWQPLEQHTAVQQCQQPCATAMHVLHFTPPGGPSKENARKAPKQAGPPHTFNPGSAQSLKAWSAELRTRMHSEMRLRTQRARLRSVGTNVCSREMPACTASDGTRALRQ